MHGLYEITVQRLASPKHHSVLHEKKGGYANNTTSMYGLAGKAEAEGVRIITGADVTGFRRANGSSSTITAVKTNQGDIDCDYVVIGAGPWVRDFWTMMELPKTISIKNADGNTHDGIGMWTFWQLEEGVLKVDPGIFKTNDGKMPPVMHVDTDAELRSTVDNSVIEEGGKIWGLYYKPDFHLAAFKAGRCPTLSLHLSMSYSLTLMVPPLPNGYLRQSSRICGSPHWRTATNALKARWRNLIKNPQAALDVSRLTISRSLMNFAKIAISSR